LEDSIKHDKALNSLSDFACRLYFMILPHADNFGRFEGDAELIKARCLPLSKRPVKKIEEAIFEICDSHLWTRYKTSKDKLVIQFNIEAFERINKFFIKERGEDGEYPAYEEGNEMVGRPITNKPTPTTKAEKEADKKFYGKYVRLTDEEYKRLVNERGEVFIMECIERLNLWFEQNESRLPKYKSHNACIRSWVIDAVEERRQKKGMFKYQTNPVSVSSQKLEECKYCHGKFPSITLHEINCSKAPQPASDEVVKNIFKDFKEQTENEK
jgi:hypothetical protein